MHQVDDSSEETFINFLFLWKSRFPPKKFYNIDFWDTSVPITTLHTLVFGVILPSYQCRPSLAKFHHLGEILKLCGNRLRVYLVFRKILHLLWKNFNCIGQYFKIRIEIKVWFRESSWSTCSHKIRIGFILVNSIFTINPLNERKKFFEMV